jgi:uncharacterized protein DUF1566
MNSHATTRNLILFNRNLKRVVLFTILLSFVFTGVSCKEDASNLSKEQDAIKKFNSAFGDYLVSAEKVGQATTEVKRIATSDGANTLDDLVNTEISDSMLGEHGDALANLDMETRATLVRAFRLLEAALEYEVAKSQQNSSGPGEGQYLVERDFGITALIILGASIALGTSVAVKKTKEMGQQYCGKVRSILSTSLNQQCLDGFALMLDFPSGQTATGDALATYLDSRPDMLRKCTELKTSMRSFKNDMEGQNPPVMCNAPSASDISSSLIQSTTETGIIGLEMADSAYGGMTSTVLSKGVGLLAGSDTLGDIADLTLQTTKALADETGGNLPTNENVSVAVVADSTQSIAVGGPVAASVEDVIGSSDVAKAIEALESTESTTEEVIAATDTLTRTTANTPGTQVVSQSDGTGGMVVDAPAGIYVGEYGIEGLHDQVELPVPNLGFSTIIVLTPSRVPQIELGADLSDGETMNYPDELIEDFGEEKPGDSLIPETGLNVVNETGGAAAGEDVTLSVYCPESVDFPATLDGTAPSATSLAWSSPITSCPVTVFFNADNSGSYPLSFTLTDALGVTHSGSVTVTISDGTSTDTDTDTGTGSETGPGVWTDTSTDLMWQNPNLDNAVLNWSDAVDYCGDLSVSSYSDWRLPTISELRTITSGCASIAPDGLCGVTDSCLSAADCQDAGDSDCGGCGGTVNDSIEQYLNPELSQFVADTIWSSSERSDKPELNRAWGLSFLYGSITSWNKDLSEAVRCVRDAG